MIDLFHVDGVCLNWACTSFKDDWNDNIVYCAPHIQLDVKEYNHFWMKIQLLYWTVSCRVMMSVCLEWSESKSDCKFEFSMLKEHPLQIFDAIGTTSGFCLMRLASDFLPKQHWTVYKKVEFYFPSFSHYFEKSSMQYHP